MDSTLPTEHLFDLVSRVSILTGRVALDDEVPNAVAKTFAMLEMKRNGKVRVIIANEKNNESQMWNKCLFFIVTIK